MPTQTLPVKALGHGSITQHKPSRQESLDSILNTTKERKKRKEKETNKPAGAFGLKAAFDYNYPSPNLEWNQRFSQKRQEEAPFTVRLIPASLPYTAKH